MSDVFVLLLAPAGGDELQGVKRGIMESADLILVNKADGALAAVAQRTCADYAGALRLMRPRVHDPEGFPKAMTVSALDGTGLEAAWAEIGALVSWRKAEGHWAARRQAQARHWFADEVHQGLLARLQSDPELSRRMQALGDEVARGARAPGAAAAELLAALGGADEE